VVLAVGERRDPRIQTNTRAMVWLGTRAAPFTIDNLSLGGARLIGSMALRLGQQIAIELALDSGPVKVVGEVVRVDTPDLLEDQIAVRFVDLSSDVRTALRATVSRRLAEVPETDEPSIERDPFAHGSNLADPVAGKLGDDEPEIELETGD
jgi:hypothetical protein